MRLKPSDILIFYCNDSFDCDYIWKLQGRASEAGILVYTVPAEGQASIQVNRTSSDGGPYPHYQLGPRTIAWLNASFDLLIGNKNSREAKQKLDKIMRDPKLQPERLSFAGAML